MSKKLSYIIKQIMLTNLFILIEYCNNKEFKTYYKNFAKQIILELEKNN